jgi:hypothetical protein
VTCYQPRYEFQDFEGQLCENLYDNIDDGCYLTLVWDEVPCNTGGGEGSGDDEVVPGTIIPWPDDEYSGGGDGGSSGGGSSGSGSSEPTTIPEDEPIGVISPILKPLATEELLSNLLEEDPFALIEIPCDQLPKWQTLAQNKASQSIKDKINQLDANSVWFDSWAIQTLNEANGTIANMDYFSVSVSNLPNNPSTGSQFTPESFLDYFRRNINDFADGSTFSPYCETPSLCTQETNLWNSDNPIGAIVYIDIPGDDGVVVCSEFTSSYWYFMTLEAPGAGNHPVSGTRQFGFEPNGTGGYNFFVRGVDRFDSNIAENTLYMVALGNPFFGADALWASFQNKMNQFINNNNGSATINTPLKYRPDWKKVQEILEGERPISDLGCK